MLFFFIIIFFIKILIILDYLYRPKYGLRDRLSTVILKSDKVENEDTDNDVRDMSEHPWHSSKVEVLELMKVSDTDLHSQKNSTYQSFVKLNYISVICMLGGLLVVCLFNLAPLDNIFISHKWESFYKTDFLDEFLFGYFITLVILFLFKNKDKFK